MNRDEENTMEAEMQNKGRNAPRITPDYIDSHIGDEAYYVFPGTTLTVCCLTLSNGFTVLGESACAAPENFDQEIGRRIARDNARDKIWALEGYTLRNALSGRAPYNTAMGPQPGAQPAQDAQAFKPEVGYRSDGEKVK